MVPPQSGLTGSPPGVGSGSPTVSKGGGCMFVIVAPFGALTRGIRRLARRGRAAMSPAGGAPGADAEAADAGTIGATEITLAFDQATVDLDALQRSAYAVAAEMTVDIRVSRHELRVHSFPAQARCD